MKFQNIICVVAATMSINAFAEYRYVGGDIFALARI